MKKCAFASTAFLLSHGVRCVYCCTLNHTGRLVLAVVQSRSSLPAQPWVPLTTASALFYSKLKFGRVFSIGSSWCSVCACRSDYTPQLVEDLHKLAWIQSHSTPSRPCRLRSRTTPTRSSWKSFCDWSTQNMRDSWILVNSTCWPQQSLERGGCLSSVKKRNSWWRRGIGKWLRKAGSATNLPPSHPGHLRPCRLGSPWFFPLSVRLSLGWGTSMLGELSSVGPTVLVHGSALHKFPMPRNARGCPAAEQSPVTNAATPQVPDDDRLTPRLGAVLHPFRGRPLPSPWDQRYLYQVEYDTVTPESFVFGRPLRGCFCIASPKKGNSHCELPTARLPSQCFGTRLSSLRLGINCWVCCCGTGFRSVVGQSLATGVNAPPGPVLAGLASRLGDVLRPIRERHLYSWADQRVSCTGGHGVEKLYRFLAGCLCSGLCAQRLLDVVCGAVQGTALCVELAQVIAGVQLIAASKALCRFTSKCLCLAFCSDAQRLSGSLHVDVASPLGLEAAIHTISKYGDQCATSMFQFGMTIVFHNVFQSLDKNALLTACRCGIPTLTAWTSWCYSVPFRPLYDVRVVNSTAGVQQGDNLGPLLFATTTHRLLGELKDLLDIDLVIGYLDDIVVTGDCEAVLRALLVLQRSIPSLGLTLIMAKRGLIPLAGSLNTSDFTRFPAQIARVPSGFLDAPVGDREFGASFVQNKRAAKADVFLTEISGIDDAQVVHKLLCRCMGTPRIMHAMRTTRPDWMHLCRNGFTWCYKVGENSRSDCRQQRISQFCGSSWAHGSVSVVPLIFPPSANLSWVVDTSVLRTCTWSVLLVPFLWSAAAVEDQVEWPSVIADLCGNNVNAGSGLSMGAVSVQTCWVQWRAVFRTAEVGYMQDLFLVVGTPLLGKLSFLDSAVSDHSLAPHHALVHHLDRARLAAGSFLATGVDSSPGSDARGLVSCFDAALHTLQKRYVLPRRCQVDSCSVDYAMGAPHSFLSGYPRSVCSNSASLQEAEGHCESLPGCGGFTAVSLVVQVHLGSEPSPSMLVQCCWLRRCGKGFAWCNKDGVYYCSDSCERHILQFCGSSWALGAVSALADRIKYARGETGLDIYSSAQHLLNCDWRGNHFRFVCCSHLWPRLRNSRGVIRMSCTTSLKVENSTSLSFVVPVGRFAPCLKGSGSLVVRKVSTSTHQCSTP